MAGHTCRAAGVGQSQVDEDRLRLEGGVPVKEGSRSGDDVHPQWSCVPSSLALRKRGVVLDADGDLCLPELLCDGPVEDAVVGDGVPPGLTASERVQLRHLFVAAPLPERKGPPLLSMSPY